MMPRHARPRLARTAIALVAMGLVAPSLAAAQEAPQAVRDAASSAVRVLTSGESGTAFPIDDGGRYLTATAIVARSAQITLVLDDGREVAATRVTTNAPGRLTVLKIATPGEVTPVPIADAAPKGDTRLWIAAVDREGALRLRPTTLRNARESGALETSSTNVAGLNGGPLLSARGIAVGVAVPPAPGVRSDALAAVGLTAVPVESAAVVVTDDSSFPAVPTAIGLGFLLLLGSGAARFSRARSAPPASPVPTSAPTARVPPPGAPAPGELDDLEITLKSRG